jgi:DNA-binding CsgD family transcriptional regulator
MAPNAASPFAPAPHRCRISVEDDGDGRARATLVARAALAWKEGLVDPALELLWEADGCCTRHDDGGGYPGLALSVIFATLGRPDEAEACLLAASDEISLRGDPFWAPAPAAFAARIELLRGDTDAAREQARTALWLASEHGTGNLEPVAHDVLIGVAVQRGELGDAHEQMEAWRQQDPMGRLPFGTAHRNWAAVRLHDAQGCAVLSDGVTEASFDLLATDRCLLLEDPSAAAWLVRTARQAGDDRRVRRIVRTVEELAADNSRYPSVVASAAHACSLAEEDPAGVEVAASTHRWPWASASAAEDAATLHLAHGDRSAARSWLEQASKGYVACGATRDSARIRARLRDIGVRSGHWSREARPVSGWDSLTETERSVAEHVAEGLTNQQVADRMFLSRHTIDFHLRHIFRKLDIDSRVLLARFALRISPANA